MCLILVMYVHTSAYLCTTNRDRGSLLPAGAAGGVINELSFGIIIYI